MSRQLLVTLTNLALVAALSLTAADARAKSARALLAQGNALLAKGDYEAAYRAYDAGYKKAPKQPAFLRSMALCKLKLYQHAQARKLLQDYLAKFPKAKDVEKVKQTVDKLEQVVETKLSISSTPSATVFIDAEAAGAVGKTPLELTIEPGTHTVLLQRKGFHLTTRTFTIAPREAKKLSVPLESPLSVKSEPAGAAVRIDDPKAKPLGKTPLEAGIPPGSHTVYIAAAGYKTHQRKVSVGAGKPVAIDVSLDLGLTVRSEPAGAKVTVDGKPVDGATPLEIAVTPGKHTIAVEHSGFDRFEKKLDVQPGKDASFTASLVGGLLTMRTNVAGATVRVGNLEVGRTPIQRAQVPLGKRQVSITHPDRRTWEMGLNFTRNDLVRADVSLGRRSWPLWTMVGIAGAAAVAWAVTGALAIKRTNDRNDAPIFRTSAAKQQAGTGECNDDGSPATFGSAPAFDADGQRIESGHCSLGMHHAATALAAVTGASAVGALIYYLFFMRSSETITRSSRGEAVSASSAAATR